MLYLVLIVSVIAVCSNLYLLKRLNKIEKEYEAIKMWKITHSKSEKDIKDNIVLLNNSIVEIDDTLSSVENDIISVKTAYSSKELDRQRVLIDDLYQRYAEETYPQ